MTTQPDMPDQIFLILHEDTGLTMHDTPYDPLCVRFIRADVPDTQSDVREGADIDWTRRAKQALIEAKSKAAYGHIGKAIECCDLALEALTRSVDVNIRPDIIQGAIDFLQREHLPQPNPSYETGSLIHQYYEAMKLCLKAALTRPLELPDLATAMKVVFDAGYKIHGSFGWVQDSRGLIRGKDGG